VQLVYGEDSLSEEKLMNKSEAIKCLWEGKTVIQADCGAFSRYRMMDGSLYYLSHEGVWVKALKTPEAFLGNTNDYMLPEQEEKILSKLYDRGPAHLYKHEKKPHQGKSAAEIMKDAGVYNALEGRKIGIRTDFKLSEGGLAESAPILQVAENAKARVCSCNEAETASADSAVGKLIKEDNSMLVEVAILDHIRCAWDNWVSLSDKHPDDDNEFRAKIHELQRMIAAREARRANPRTWGF
jgi:hypothetical protein